MRITLLKGGGGDTYYELGLLSGLITKGIKVEFIGSDHMKTADILSHESVDFFNLRGSEDPNASILDKILRILKYYFRLIRYAAFTRSELFHIQWFDKLIYFERTFMILYYKLLGKKLVYTAHNINAGERDGTDNLINRTTLKFLYKNVDHIIVHTNMMKKHLIKDFHIIDYKISVIQHGINNAVPTSELSRFHARKLLQLDMNEKILLFFGNITPYKGLEYLIQALHLIKDKFDNVKLVIAGRIKNHEGYWCKIEKLINEYHLANYIISRTEFIPDEEIEVYFKAADVLVLPYKFIFQSGPLFLAYNFGLAAIAPDVGSFSEDIIEGKTGFIYEPGSAENLAKKIDGYFQSNLYDNLEENRHNIIKYANEKYSWVKIGEKTYNLYKSLL